jgi:mitochondrial fission protein ELM1
VLNDGRSGHLNQSLAVARQIQTARTTQGYKMEDTRIVVRDVRYSSGLKRAALTISGAFSSWRCHGCMACMRYCLERESCEGLMKTYCDFVVSCGSGLAPVNAFMARENNAKNIVVMSPGIVGLGKFNLAVIPRHDRPRPAKNVVATELAPNLIDEGTLKLKAETFAAALGLKRERRRIGLLVGGDTPEFTLSVELMNRVADGIISAAETLEAELLVTTSRRTPKAVETLMKDRLKGNPRCKLLVIANEDNPEGAVAGILGLSDVVVVSGESISMVSEAVSSSRPVIVFGLDRRKARASKHEAAMRRLEAAGRLIISDPAGMKDEILRSTDNPRQAARCGDNERIYEAVRRLI